MKKFNITFIFVFAFVYLIAVGMGSYNKTFTDPARNNRQVPTTIYYPIDSINPFATFPYIVYGHGWNGSCESYGVLTNAVVNLGWIIAYPRTEESVFGYSVTNLAQDMVFLKNAVYSETLNFTSPIYTKIDTLAIVAGYSMGGACAVAAASLEPEYASLVTLAAAPRTILNLYPASINMALSVTIPSVTFSGSADNTAPSGDNQLPIYINLASDYKSFVSLTGQGHINFYNNTLIYTILEPWFNYIKTGSVFYIDAFEAVLAAHPSELTFQIVNNLVIELETPQTILIEREDNNLQISWDPILEAHGYRVFASDNPYTVFSEISDQGSFILGSRVSWITPIPSLLHKFYYIKSYR